MADIFSFLVRLLSKEKLKIKSCGFSRPLYSVFCNSELSQFCPILKNLVSKFKLRSCLTNDTQFSHLTVLRTKIYDFKLVHFLETPGILCFTLVEPFLISIGTKWEWFQPSHNLHAIG